MRHLIIPDIHEDIETADYILNNVEHDAAIFLGDVMDDWGDKPEDITRTTRWWNKIIRDPKNTVLLGNHDHPYIWPHIFRRDGVWGMTDDKLLHFQAAFDCDLIHKLKFLHRVGDFLCSHAGVQFNGLRPERSRWVYENHETENKRLLDALFAGMLPSELSVGRSRGGELPYGGYTWLDWDREFHMDPTFPQIVGHTPHAEVKTRTGDEREDGSMITSYDLDTRLENYGVIDDLRPRELSLFSVADIGIKEDYDRPEQNTGAGD